METQVKTAQPTVEATFGSDGRVEVRRWDRFQNPTYLDLSIEEATALYMELEREITKSGGE